MFYLSLHILKDSIWEKETDERSKFQTHLKNNQGISFVRNGREIDFGNFGYYHFI